MIERDIVAKKIKEFQIQEYVGNQVRRSGYSSTKLQRTPLGEKIIVYASRPGLVVGRQGQNIRKLTEELKEKFGLENPQIEVGEVDNINLDANIVAEMIALNLERFGSQRFKAIMHRTMANVLQAGALGVEIILSGKLPSARARSWRVFAGYLKKCGDISISGVRKAKAVAQLKSGVIGVKVSIMPPDIELPDRITITDGETVEESTEKASDNELVKDEKKADKSELDSPAESTGKNNSEEKEVDLVKPEKKEDMPIKDSPKESVKEEVDLIKQEETDE